MSLTAAIMEFAVRVLGQEYATPLGQRQPQQEIDDQRGENKGREREMPPKNLKIG